VDDLEPIGISVPEGKEGDMARMQFRESGQAALLQLHSTLGLLTRLEESAYLDKTGISYQQFQVLLTVRSGDPPVSQSFIARRVQHKLNSISMIADRMEKQGLISRVRSNDDRREVHVSLTPLGSEKLKQAVEVGVPLSERVASVLSEDEINEMTRLMTKLKKQIFTEMGTPEPDAAKELSDTRRVLSVLKKTHRTGAR
jgi:MarR family transcriptional regulator, organic hydroperoxide resistance regulator